jgi:hypothetical protein
MKDANTLTWNLRSAEPSGCEHYRFNHLDQFEGLVIELPQRN